MRQLSTCVFLVLLTSGACASERDQRVETSSTETCPVTKVIARGAPIHGSNGLALDGDGQLLIASLIGDAIVVMDPDSGDILDQRTPAVAPAPDDLAIGPDGSLYWTSLPTGYVGRLSPDGQSSSQFVAPGVNPITFSADGRLFVGLDFLGDGLYELDPELVTPPRAIVPYAPGEYPLGFLNGFDFGADGRLYGPLWLLGMVVSIDVDSCSGTVTPWIDCDIQPVVTGLEVPTAVKFDAAGRLHVTTVGGEVLRISDTGTPTLVATLSPGLDNLVFDAANRLFVSNYEDGSIARVVEGDIEYISPGGMILPSGVALVDRGHGTDALFVADGMSLREFSPASGKQRGVERSILAITPLQPPVGVSADGLDLVLTSAFTFTVQVMSSESRELLESYQMPTPPFDAVRFQSTLAASTFDSALGHGQVVRVATGETILGPPYVFYPVGLAAAGDVLFVSDWYTGLVWQVDLATGMPVPSLIAAGLSQPEGLALDHAGGLLVVESGAGRLSRIDLATGGVTTIAEDLALGVLGSVPAFPPHGAINGVAVGSSGDIFVTGEKENVLYRIHPETDRPGCRPRGEP